MLVNFFSAENDRCSKCARNRVLRTDWCAIGARKTAWSSSRRWVLLCVFLSAVPPILNQVAEPLKTSNLCTSKKTCGECIVSHPDCAWCSEENFDGVYPRCDEEAALLQHGCPKSHVTFPKSEVSAHKDMPLSHAKAQGGSVVQLKPQKVKLRLRPNHEVPIMVSFRQAEDYPVDLYYLMDLTYSMFDDKLKLAELGDQLADRMSGITSNFRLGFGSFVDKKVMPYVDTFPPKLENPCPDEKYCVAPYGFRNHMSLSNDTRRFSKEVKNAEISGNLDDAEGGFDALMQVVVCTEKIRWDEKSRKIVLFATDSGFHYAGDGKLGGIIRPNDENCHLSDDGYYTYSTEQDYPSITQIKKQILQHKVHVIFAVPPDQEYMYNRVSSAIEAASTATLLDDSSNIVELVRGQYDKIRSEVILKDNAPPGTVVTYRSKCLGEVLEETNQCANLTVGTTVTFEISISVESCPNNTDAYVQKFNIFPLGLNEVLEVHLELLCACDCEAKEKQEVNSTECSESGTHSCGICQCNQNRFGRRCECDGDSALQTDDSQNCKSGNTSQVCSGRGDCVCGVCECHVPENIDHRYYGPYCECDNFNCEWTEDREMCGGPSKGRCDCGTCVCNKGWTGNTCTCRVGIESCQSPVDGSICSNNGDCKCGACECRKGEGGLFGGPYCEECPSCRGRCVVYKPCVECQAFGKGQYGRDECVSECASTPVQPVIHLIERPGDRRCIYTDEYGCSYTFTYNFDKNQKPIIQVLKDKECPPTVDATAIIMSVSGAIVFIGLVCVFIVRLLVYIKDKREWERFEKETKHPKFQEEANPLYREAISKFENPTYRANRSEM